MSPSLGAEEGTEPGTVTGLLAKPLERAEGVLGVIQNPTKSQRGFRGGKRPALPTELTAKGVKPAQARRSAPLGWSFSLFS